MTTSTDRGVWTFDEWGTYIPGERVEIEPGNWTLSEVGGLPEQDAAVANRRRPDGARSDKDGYYLVQRHDRSPHPMIWHSKKYETLERARDAYAWRRFIDAPENSIEQKLRIPGVSDYAFAYHHSPFGCSTTEGGSAGSLAECTNNHECVERAVAQVSEVIDRSRVVGMMLV
jgi:hypothetical protein